MISARISGVKITGLSNQLFSFISAIILCKKHNHDILAIGPMTTDFFNGNYINTSKIINLEEMSIKLKIQIKDVDTFTNPPPFETQWLFWFDQIDHDMFDDILDALQFQPIFYDIGTELYKKYVIQDLPMHVVHFRIEQDAINFWAKRNNMTPAAFSTKFKNIYTNLLNTHIPKGEQILALTYSINDPFIQNLKKDYKIIAIDGEQILKERLNLQGRELSAIIDLCVAKYCNGVYICCHTFHKKNTKRSSTFSYIVNSVIENATKRICIPMGDLNLPIEIRTIKRLR